MERRDIALSRINKSANDGSDVHGVFQYLSFKIRKAFADSFIGHILTSYDKVSEKFERSRSVGFVRTILKSAGVSKPCEAFSRAFDRSCTRKTVLGITDKMRHATPRFYGVALITFSLYVAIMYLIRRYGMFYSASDSYLYVSVAGMLISVPLLFEKEKTLGTVLLESKFFSWLLFRFFDSRYENFRDRHDSYNRVSAAFIIGMIFGCFSFFVSPVLIVLAIAFLLYVYLTLISPEAGLLVCFLGLPFMSFFDHPTVTLLLLEGCVFFSFIIKLIRKKRVFSFGVLETAVFLFLLVMLFSGTKNASMSTSLDTIAAVSLIFGTYLCANLLRTKEMLKHAIKAVALSASICAFIGVLEYFLGMAQIGWLDVEMFSSIGGRAVSLFENPNVLGTYLVLGAPLTLSLVSIEKDRDKTRWFICFAVIITCCVLTWSRGAWIGILVSVFVLLATTNYFVSFTLASAAMIPLFVYVLPTSVLQRFISIGNLSDSSTLYRLNIWRGCIDMAEDYALAGIGVGEDAFLRLYPKYAVSGTEVAYHAHSLPLQLLLSLGICGLFIFLVVLFFFFQRSFSMMHNTEDKDLKSIVSAVVASVCGFLVNGLFDYTWYNWRVFFLFFALMGIMCAADRISRKNRGEMYEYR